MPVNTPIQRFREVFGANFDVVQAYCLRRLPPDEAADAVSEVFLVAWRRVEEIPEDTDARLWLFGVARNVVRNLDRTSRRRFRTVTRLGGLATPPPTDPETQVLVAAEHRQVLDAFRRLSSDEQEVLHLRLWEELSVAESATVLGCSAKAASKRYQRALSRLDRTFGISSVPMIDSRHWSEGGKQ